jgi:hypothetical protein
MLSSSEPNTETAVKKKRLQTKFGLSSIDSDPSVRYSAFSKNEY